MEKEGSMIEFQMGRRLIQWKGAIFSGWIGLTDVSFFRGKVTPQESIERHSEVVHGESISKSLKTRYSF